MQAMNKGIGETVYRHVLPMPGAGAAHGNTRRATASAGSIKRRPSASWFQRNSGRVSGAMAFDHGMTNQQ